MHPAFLTSPKKTASISTRPLRRAVPSFPSSQQLNQFMGLDPSQNLPTTGTWTIASEQTAQAGPSTIASHSGPMIGDMTGISVALGANTNALHTGYDFERSLATMTNIKQLVTFLAEDVTLQNAEFLERLVKESMSKHMQITSALTIPTPADSAIVSRTRTSTMHANYKEHVRCNLS